MLAVDAVAPTVARRLAEPIEMREMTQQALCDGTAPDDNVDRPFNIYRLDMCSRETGKCACWQARSAGPCVIVGGPVVRPRFVDAREFVRGKSTSAVR
jgi:hypothetical protein